MKVIAILENNISVGGGFNQALNAILQMKKICESRFQFEVLTLHSSNVTYLQKIGIEATYFRFSFIDRLLSSSTLNLLWGQTLRKYKVVSPFEKKLISRNCDLVYFVTPSATYAILQRLNYVATVWDLCHRDSPEFPEVRDFGEFHYRERTYGNGLASAFITITDSLQLSERVSFRYGVDPNRLLAMPFSPTPFLDIEFSNDVAAVRKKHSLPQDFFFYPAQFWAHKNHIRILEALIFLKSTGVKYNVVFAGGEHGNRSHVENIVAKHGLQDQVWFLGFVSPDDMHGLYSTCTAVVMPTYFGPTNLPPLEAWTIGKPLIYSSIFQEQAGNAALLIDPDSSIELAQAMQACSQLDVREKLVSAGKRRLAEISQQRVEAEIELLRRLTKFEVRRKCWP